MCSNTPVGIVGTSAGPVGKISVDGSALQQAVAELSQIRHRTVMGEAAAEALSRTVSGEKRAPAGKSGHSQRKQTSCFPPFANYMHPTQYYLAELRAVISPQKGCLQWVRGAAAATHGPIEKAHDDRSNSAAALERMPATWGLTER